MATALEKDYQSRYFMTQGVSWADIIVLSFSILAYFGFDVTKLNILEWNPLEYLVLLAPLIAQGLQIGLLVISDLLAEFDLGADVESFIYYVTVLASVFTQATGNLVYYVLAVATVLSLALLPIGLILFAISLPFLIVGTPIVLTVLGIMYFSEVVDFIEGAFSKLYSITFNTPFTMRNFEFWEWTALVTLTLIQAFISFGLTSASVWPYLAMIQWFGDNSILAAGVSAVIDAVVAILTPLPYMIMPFILALLYQGFGDSGLRDWIYKGMMLSFFMLPVGILFGLPDQLLKVIMAIYHTSGEMPTVVKIVEGQGMVAFVGGIFLAIGIVGMGMVTIFLWITNELGLNRTPKNGTPEVGQSNPIWLVPFEGWELPSEWYQWLIVVGLLPTIQTVKSAVEAAFLVEMVDFKKIAVE